MKKRMLLALLFLVAAFIISMCLGRYHLSPLGIIKIIANTFGTHFDLGPGATTMEKIFWQIRLPRTLLVMVVGMGLGISGTVFQAVFRNPLVSPDILGVSSGAGFGAALAIMVIGGGQVTLQLLAFVFGMAGVFISFAIARRPRADSIIVLVLSGIIVSALFSAGLALMKYIADPYEKLPAIVFWTMGSFNTVRWPDLAYPVPIVVIGLVLLTVFSWRLNLLSLGEEEAMSLGVNVKRTRFLFLFTSTLMVASSISVCGIISWLALVVPHIGRYIVGSDHKVLAPFSAMAGGGLLLLMDTLARTILPAEIPISIITSLIGAPFLAYLLVRGREGAWNT